MKPLNKLDPKKTAEELATLIGARPESDPHDSPAETVLDALTAAQTLVQGIIGTEEHPVTDDTAE